MATSRLLWTTSSSFLFDDVASHSIKNNSNNASAAAIGRRRRNFYVTQRKSLMVQAAKLPTGVELPKEQPKFNPPFLGFTKTAEVWNSRACMIGLIGTFVVELILNKGILQIIGVEVGKGLNLPL